MSDLPPEPLQCRSDVLGRPVAYAGDAEDPSNVILEVTFVLDD